MNNKVLEEQIKEQIELVSREVISKLDFSNYKVSEFPKDLWKLWSLVFLDISNNELEELPPEISQLTNLRYLYIRGNKLLKIPSEINSLWKLRVLDLTGNDLSELPHEIGKLKELRVLSVSGNKLQKFPSQIGNLSNLTHVCAGNFLIWGDDFRGQPARWYGSKDKHNQITALPSELLLNKKLEFLDLIGNPLPIPPEILDV